MFDLPRSFERALGQFQRGNLPAADKLLGDITRAAPRFPPAWSLRGIVACERERHDDAVRFLEKAVALAPHDAGIRGNLGEALRKADRAEEALACLQEALRLDPGLTSTYVHHGLALLDLERPGAAVATLERALSIDPNSVEAHHALGRAHSELSRYRDAIAHLRCARALSPDNPKVLSRLAGALFDAGDLDEAYELYRQLHERTPDDLTYLGGQAAILERKGDFEAAYALLRPYIDRGLDHPQIATSLVTISRRVGAEAEARALAERALETHGDAIGLLFALGRLNDSLDNFDEAFDCYRRANALRAKPTFDLDARLALHERIAATFTPERMAGLPRSSNRSEVPVFVVGMPRSGTTLVEQIIACHPRAYGAGELTDLNEVAQFLPALLGTKERYPEAVAAADAGALDRIAAHHLERLANLSNGAERVVDKLPSNYQRLGLIAMLFPRARIIHCRRNPLDTCLSCYFQNFQKGHEYAYDLVSLGAMWRAYDRLMAHWREVLDIDLLEMQYEELVADQEAKSREMIDFLGLEWDDRCLAFYEHKRVVKTASYDQVRRPIYDRSVERWRHYERHLDPLKDVLGPAA